VEPPSASAVSYDLPIFSVAALESPGERIPPVLVTAPPIVPVPPSVAPEATLTSPVAPL